MKASVIIPAYNEEKGIEAVIKQFKEIAEKNKITLEIIVVDDGSNDKTANIAKKQRVKVISHPQNYGYGKSLQTGIIKAKNERIIICDADGTYPVKYFPKLLMFLDKGFDMVVGARKGRHYRGLFLKHPARVFFKLLSEFVTGKIIPDVNSGFRAFRKSDVLGFLKNTCSTFSFTTSLTLIYHLESKFIKYLPIPYYLRKGKTKVKYVRDTLRTGQILTETIIYYNPIKLFLLISIFFFLLFVIFLILYLFLFKIIFLIFFSIFFLSSIIALCFGFLASIFKKGNERN